MDRREYTVTFWGMLAALAAAFWSVRNRKETI